jgi:hypothetical protein
MVKIKYLRIVQFKKKREKKQMFIWNASAFCYQESITTTVLALFETF